MLAPQSALKIQESIVIEVINNNLEVCWLNKSKYLWMVDVSIVSHALYLILVLDPHKKIIESSY